MMNCIQLEHPALIQQLRDAYLRTLIAPMDGMWENAVIAHASFWEIQDQGEHVGHFCLDADRYLLRFHLLEDYLARAQEIFRWIISTYALHSAITSTIEPPYLSLCLDNQRSITLYSYLFRDSKHRELPPDLSNYLFGRAEVSAFEGIASFYRANAEGPGEWIEPFLSERLARNELFVLFDQQALVATGECIPSQKQAPYADLGIVVAQAFRGRGLGSFMLTRLKHYCYTAGWKPICSCAADNLASKKAIEKAGFISEHRMVKIAF
jgi:GNAT superfamily N-acetyltransferase